MPNPSSDNPFAEFGAPQAPSISRMEARVEFERRLRRLRILLLAVMPVFAAAGAAGAVALRFGPDVLHLAFPFALAGAAAGLLAGILAAILTWAMMGLRLQGAGRLAGYNLLRDNTPVILTIWLIIWAVVGIVPGASIGAIKGASRARQKDEADKRGATKYMAGSLADVAKAFELPFVLTDELRLMARMLNLPPDVDGTFVIFWIDERGQTRIDVWPDDTSRRGQLDAVGGAGAGVLSALFVFILWWLLSDRNYPRGGIVQIQ